LLLTVLGILGDPGRQWAAELLVLGRTGFVVAVAYGSIILLYSDAVDSTQQGRILGMSIAVVNLPGAWSRSLPGISLPPARGRRSDWPWAS
jgi:hypothetical protein